LILSCAHAELDSKTLANAVAPSTLFTMVLPPISLL
jgi:hypothetical protein